MPLNSKLPSASGDDSQPAAMSSSSGASRSPLRTPSTSSEPGLAIPFEQLSLHDEQHLMKHHRIAYDHSHAPHDPSVGNEHNQNRPYVDESMIRGIAQNGQEKGTGRTAEDNVVNSRANVARVAKTTPSDLCYQPVMRACNRCSRLPAGRFEGSTGCLSQWRERREEAEQRGRED
ncbi:uncharacterized protein LAESUDRAFT_350122 [Laetiporus sulphureus 93-53]|uniref:Uncharacterized protein n=1 Tax=Laetiporus sulphureus 93-53 TaxID=1314785 RepID=A0A165GTE0_9APHY|nr:uncharacterized protein LAESUDRAFT_350122 [Laetiporus sulphureus 93-53]KZT10787.1 hypothetical protein LAESUDRAFT_350122 [Laetiporus sulphureus 93-53]